MSFALNLSIQKLDRRIRQSPHAVVGAKSFWDEFFQVLGVRLRLIATFEERVKNIKGQCGFIDVFWRGLVLAEHKSRGKSLDKAESQAWKPRRGGS